jgi:hypothetical protein
MRKEGRLIFITLPLNLAAVVTDAAIDMPKNSKLGTLLFAGLKSAQVNDIPNSDSQSAGLGRNVKSQEDIPFRVTPARLR